jgi:Chlorophyll A-B binding protein
MMMMMMKTAIVACLMATTSAFAPPVPTSSSSSSSRSTAISSASPYAGEVGALAPLGFFDPLNLCGEACPQSTFDLLRTIELKHGRVAMLAIVGYLTTLSGVRLPGLENVGNGFAALYVTDLPTDVRGVLPLTLACIGFLELIMRDVNGTMEFPGDYRNGAIDFGWNQQSAAWQLQKRTVELNNGRAAQMGILALMLHESFGNLGEIVKF